jgi:phosphate transport system permease protein
MLQESETRKFNFNKITGSQLITVITAFIVLFFGLDILIRLISLSLDFLEEGLDINSFIFILSSLFFLLYLIIYLYINHFLTRSIYKLFFSVFMIILFLLTSATIGGKGELFNLETFIYFVVIGFLLLFVYIYTVQNVKNEKTIHAVLLFAAIFAIIIIVIIFFFLINEGYPVFFEVGVIEFLLGTEWVPDSFIQEKFGAFPLIWASVVTATGSIIISVPLSIGVAIFISELAPERLKALIKPAVELLAGIPSVVIGFFGLVVLVPFLQEPIPGYFFLASGSTSFTGMLILAIMALPTITSVSEDAINSVPMAYKEASLAMGATKWQTISRVTVPAAFSGITAAIILGMGRAIGETMAVMMVMGNAARIELNIFQAMRTITGSLAIEMGETAIGSTHYHALFGLALILLIITLFINLSSIVIIDRLKISYTKKDPSRFGQVMEQHSKAFKYFVLILCAFVAGLFLTFSISILGTLLLYILIYLLYDYKRNWYDNLPALKKEKIAYIILTISILIVMSILTIVVSFIVINGLPALTWEFLTQPPVGLSGGIFPAILGTFYLVLGTLVFALPIGISAAIYLVEFQKEGRLTKIIRSGFDLLNGTPSIVFGLFGFAFFVIALLGEPSMLAGQITLGLMILPTVLRTTEEALKAVPQTIREGSLALGATKWQTIRRVVLPPAFPGIITGAVLSIGRAAGETAPILFTAAVFIQPDLPTSLLDPVMALPYHLFVLTEYPASSLQRFGTALVLLIIVIGFYLIAIIIRNYYRKKIRW